MAETTHLKDGRTVVIFDTDKQLEELIREALGDDVVRYLRALNAEHEDLLLVLGDNAEQQERIADGYLALLRDARDTFQNIQDLLERGCSDRKFIQRVAEMAKFGFELINKNL